MLTDRLVQRSGGAVTVLRNTRAGGVFFNCSSGGKAKPMSMASTVTSAIGKGDNEAAGSSLGIRLLSSHTNPDWAR